MRTKFYALAGLALIAVAGTVAYATTRTTQAAPQPTATAPTVAAKPADCCDDPTCPPGGRPECPPDCAAAKAAAKESCCAGDGCPAEKAPAKRFVCPPCPFCPGF